MNRRLQKIIKTSLLYVLLIVIGITMVMPFVWMISTSLKEEGAVFSIRPQWIPHPLIFKNYAVVWNALPFARFFWNSLFVATSITIGQVVTSSLAAYAFARLEFPGRDKVFFAYLATLMIPMHVTMIPLFVLIRKIGWIDSYKALILPAMFTAYGTFMLRQFFLTIPKELEEAAIIDGCNRLGIYWNVILPLSLPAIATLSTFTFLGNWNSFIWPLIVTISNEIKTLPVGLATLQGQYSTDWTILMAGSVIVIVPVLIVFIFNQRFFVKGIVMSGLKG
ncbi:MAG: carbohydrate ABC transporter permease [Candidatus Omnitrophota bacterium]